MARLMVPATQAVVKEPSKVKFRNYLRYYDAEESEPIQLTPEGFAALYGAVRKQDG